MAITKNFLGTDIQFGTVTPPTHSSREAGATYFVTSDGTKDGTITEQWLYTKDGWIKSNVAAQPETVTTLSLSANTLSYVDEAGVTTDIDLSLYLDDTNLARLVSGTLDGVTGIATFTRDDNTTFTIDLSALNIKRVEDLTDVELTSIAVGQMLVWDGAKWINQDVPEGVTTLAELTDTDLSAGLNEKNILAWDSTASKWKSAYTPKVIFNTPVNPDTILNTITPSSTTFTSAERSILVNNPKSIIANDDLSLAIFVPGNEFASVGSFKPYYSTNKGQTWNQSATTLSGFTEDPVRFTGKLGSIYFGISTNHASVAWTTDGNTWQQNLAPTNGVMGRNLIVLFDDFIFGGTWYPPVTSYKTTTAATFPTWSATKTSPGTGGIKLGVSAKGTGGGLLIDNNNNVHRVNGIDNFTSNVGVFPSECITLIWNHVNSKYYAWNNSSSQSLNIYESTDGSTWNIIKTVDSIGMPLYYANVFFDGSILIKNNVGSKGPTGTWIFDPATASFTPIAEINGYRFITSRTSNDYLGIYMPTNLIADSYAAYGKTYTAAELQAGVGGLPEYIIDDLDNVLISNKTDGDILTWDDTSEKWINIPQSAGVTNLTELTDVTLTSSANGQALIYNGTQWVNQALPSGVTELSALNDVDVTTIPPTSLSVIAWDTTKSKWVTAYVPKAVIETPAVASNDILVNDVIATGTSTVAGNSEWAMLASTANLSTIVMVNRTPGANSVRYSTDKGVTWSLSSLTTTGNPFPIFVAGKFFIYNGTTTAQQSTNGITWTPVTITTPFAISLFSTKPSPDRTYAVAASNGTNLLAETSDGITWTLVGTHTSSLNYQGFGFKYGTSEAMFIFTGSGSFYKTFYRTGPGAWTSTTTTLSASTNFAYYVVFNAVKNKWCLGTLNTASGAVYDFYESANNGASWTKVGSLGTTPQLADTSNRSTPAYITSSGDIIAPQTVGTILTGFSVLKSDYSQIIDANSGFRTGDWLIDPATNKVVMVNQYTSGAVYNVMSGTLSFAAAVKPTYIIDDLDNVNISSVQDGDVLTWDDSSSSWINATVSTGTPALNLNDLTNVDTVTPATGDYLRYTGTQWANQAFPTIPTLSSNLTDFSSYGYADNTIPFWDTSTSKWKAAVGVTAGHVLKMGPTEPEFGALNANDLGDVTITTPTNGQVLQWDGSAWVNATFSPSNTDQTVINTTGSGSLSFNASVSNVATFTPTGSLSSLNWTSVTAATSTDKATSLILVIKQGATAYLPSSYLINSSAVTVKWAGNVTPATGKANGVDVITLNVIRAGSAFTVFGQHVSFG